ncbi:MAG: thymidine phosphorylase, partial [Acidimicrobiales bacterium]
MDAIDLIVTKRDGGPLRDDQIDWFIQAYTGGSVVDEQAAALLMAILFRGLDAAELARWTQQMIASGTRADLTSLGRPTVDKHSTGGVGDKISLILCPLIAACGAAVPQTAGRGLGHTGGTIDKMETIPGWRSTLTPDEVVQILGEVGAVINAAGPDLAPADGKLYALRDITGTVESIPLIASSIMSKKIAEGTGSLVLDVKVGSGAFMKDLPRARELSQVMVGLGAANGVRTTALLTQMDVPLGRTAGNALEVIEAIEVLAGGGPSDIVDLTLVLAREMLELVGITVDPADALGDGRAMDTWLAMVRAQGGDPAAPLPSATEVEVVTAPTTGTLARLDAMAVGVAAWRLGAGRARKEDAVSPTAGVVWHATVGDQVTAGHPLLDLHLDDPARLPSALAALADAIEITPDPVPPPTLILDRIG